MVRISAYMIHTHAVQTFGRKCNLGTHLMTNTSTFELAGTSELFNFSTSSVVRNGAKCLQV